MLGRLPICCAGRGVCAGQVTGMLCRQRCVCWVGYVVLGRLCCAGRGVCGGQVMLYRQRCVCWAGYVVTR